MGKSTSKPSGLKDIVKSFDDRQHPRGCWIGILAAIAGTWNKRLSLVACIERKVKHAYPVRMSKDRAWVEEVLVLFLLVVDVAILFVLTRFVKWPWSILALIWIAYRTLDVLIFNLGWVFIDERRLVSRRRSLLGSMWNMLEVAVLATAAQFTLPVQPQLPRHRILADTLLRLITLTPPERKYYSTPCAYYTDATYTAIGAFLLLVILAGLAGTIIRNGAED